MSYVVGLTGGIGSGKTLVSDHFATLGVPIIDTDVIARQIVEPGHSVLEALVAQFGNDVLQKNGTLDRTALRQYAFSSNENKAKLDAITHPAIRSTTFEQVSQLNSPYCLVVVPLLKKSSPFSEFMHRILVVTANHETKIKRIQARSQLEPQEIERIMKTQLDDSQRLSFADDVINNDSSIDEAYRQVEILHHRYLTLAKEHTSK